MSAVPSQITSVSIVCSTVCSGEDQRKHQSSASLAFVRGIHRWPMDSPNKRPVTRKYYHLVMPWPECTHIVPALSYREFGDFGPKVGLIHSIPLVRNYSPFLRIENCMLNITFIFGRCMSPQLSCWCPGDLRSQGISRHGTNQRTRNIPSQASDELND